MTLVAAFLAAGTSGEALAQLGPRGPSAEGLDHAAMFGRIMRLARLTEEQKTQAHQIMKETREGARPLVQQLRGLHEQLADTLMAPGSLTLAEVAPLRQQIRAVETQLDDQWLGGIIKIRALLKPEQLKRIADAHAKIERLRREIEESSGPPDDGPDGDLDR